MSRLVRIISCGLVWTAVPLFATPRLPWRPTPLPALEAPLTACIAALPGDLRVEFSPTSMRRSAQVRQSARTQWDRCADLKNAWHDASATQQLIADLTRHWETGAGKSASPAVTREAAQIADVLIRATRRHAAEAKMVGSPLFNNFLIKAGVKRGGFCYEWTKVMVTALQPFPFQQFELQWGTANIGNVSENNGLLIAARGAPIETGLVYDVWRAAGRPYWHDVTTDHYKWYVRLTEHQLRMGVADALEGD